MNWLKVLLAGALVGVIVVAFRDFDNERWLVPVGPGGALGAGDEEDEEEPVLGYDGMDEETLRDWLDDADLDADALLRIRRYEEAHLARQSVLEAIDDMM